MRTRMKPWLKLVAVLAITFVAFQLIVTLVLRPRAIRDATVRLERGDLSEAEAKRLLGDDYPWQLARPASPGVEDPPATRPATTAPWED